MATSLASWDTVSEVVSDVGIELGLISAAIGDPFGSADPNMLQMIGLLKASGREIVREREWSHLHTEYVLSTVAGTANYSLPADYRRLVNQSGWNRTTMFELGGPLDAEEWQFIQAVPWGGTITSYVRFQGGQISIVPTPAGVQTIAFEYLTTRWIMAAGQTSPSDDKPSLATDTICFDPFLITRKLKLEFLKAKGFSTATAEADYKRALDAAVADDSPAPVIVMGASGDKTPLTAADMKVPLFNVGR